MADHPHIFILMVTHSERPDYARAALGTYVAFSAVKSPYGGTYPPDFWTEIRSADIFGSASEAMRMWQRNGVKGVIVEAVEFMAL